MTFLGKTEFCEIFSHSACVIFLSNKSESALLSRKTPIMNHCHQNNTELEKCYMITLLCKNITIILNFKCMGEALKHIFVNEQELDIQIITSLGEMMHLNVCIISMFQFFSNSAISRLRYCLLSQNIVVVIVGQVVLN